MGLCDIEAPLTAGSEVLKLMSRPLFTLKDVPRYLFLAEDFCFYTREGSYQGLGRTVITELNIAGDVRTQHVTS
jgi:hypothetical protein